MCRLSKWWVRNAGTHFFIFCFYYIVVLKSFSLGLSWFELGVFGNWFCVDFACIFWIASMYSSLSLLSVFSLSIKHELCQVKGLIKLWFKYNSLTILQCWRRSLAFFFLGYIGMTWVVLEQGPLEGQLANGKTS